jgi:hypothetical protein
VPERLLGHLLLKVSPYDASQGNAALISLEAECAGGKVRILLQGTEDAVVQRRHVDHVRRKKKDEY